MTLPKDESLPSQEEMFRPLDQIRKTAKPVEPLWGCFLIKKAITSIVGDPGVCKTTFGYGLSSRLCLGLPFLGIKAEEPINALYMDFESEDSLISSRANLVIGDKEIPNLIVYNLPQYFLQHVAQATIVFCNQNKINLVMIDNQSMAFNTRDENDNAEAIKQMRFLRAFTHACHASVVVFHHTSKANLPGTRKGTGAFARARLADICINLDIPDEQHPKIVRFELVKSRLIDDRVLWYLEKKEGDFVFTQPPIGAIGKPTDNTIVYQVQQAILELLGDGNEYKRKDMVDTLPFEEWAVNRGLDRLKQLNRIYSPRYSYYRRKLS